ncbi:MAG: hypothetical protein ACLPUO_20200 [Streptosporangiaceae bacterium]
MPKRRTLRRRSTWALILAPVLALAGLAMTTASQAAVRSPGAAVSHAKTTATHWVKPRSVNNLDCNAWSKKYKSVNPVHRMLCVDPHGSKSSGWYGSAAKSKYNARGRFVDNGHYVGHDEPSVKFISSAAGTGNTFTYLMKLPRDPRRLPTSTGSVTDYAQLSPAPWFGLPICDPNSYPQNPCAPDSDANIGANVKQAAGSAFMELQFYPPGYTPFIDDISCSRTQWCSALNIDSLESDFNFAHINLACEEPVNFAFLQRNGVPTGPPGPQLANANTELPNSQTLRMNPGDVLAVSVSDPASGLTTAIRDLTTHQTGYMVASASNGFMNTNYKTCAGKPFTFHAEYNTARQQNIVPWAALEGGVLMEQETGHSEVCGSLANRDPYDLSYPGGQSFTDKSVYDTCTGGGSEGRHARGEGPCNAKTGICVNPTTQGTTGPIACPSKSIASGQLCEYADGICIPKGNRTVVINGAKVKENSPVNICQADRFQNGDLDFDGVPYQKNTWPNGSSNHPTSIRYVGPFGPKGQTYPQIQFETDIAGSEFLCNVLTGNNCDAPPLSAKFYPFWTLTNKQPIASGLFPPKSCVWNFGNTIARVTMQDFGKDAQYGTPDLSFYGGTLISKVMPNPQFTGNCPAFNIKGAR